MGSDPTRRIPPRIRLFKKKSLPLSYLSMKKFGAPPATHTEDLPRTSWENHFRSALSWLFKIVVNLRTIIKPEITQKEI